MLKAALVVAGIIVFIIIAFVITALFMAIKKYYKINPEDFDQAIWDDGRFQFNVSSIGKTKLRNSNYSESDDEDDEEVSVIFEHPNA